MNTASRRRGTKWSRRTYLLTAAAAASLPFASNAFGSSSLPSHAATGVGPLHAAASSSSSLGVHEVSPYDNNSLRSKFVMSTIEAMTNPPIPVRAFSPIASTLVPPTSFISSRPRPISIPNSDCKYGGRAFGTGPTEENRLESCAEQTGASQRSGGTALGFVVEDVDGIGSSTTRLSVSSQGRHSSPDQIDESLVGGVPDSKNGKTIKNSSMSSAYNGSNTIRPVHSSKSSPIKKRVAASLLRNAPSPVTSYDMGSSGMKSERNGEGAKHYVPHWFPWIPTRSQIEALKVSELREACVERRLSKTGRKGELQHRLLDWTTEQHRRRVVDRRSGLTSGILGSSAKNRTPLDDLIDRAIEPGDISSSSSSIGEIEPLINRRKALRRSKDGIGKNGAGRDRKDAMTSFPFSTESSSVHDGRAINDVPSTDVDDDDLDDYDNILEGSDDLAVTPTKEYISSLAEAFNSPTSKFSNYEVKEMYLAAKLADQAGDRTLSKKILAELLEATPTDSRIIRRLARLEVEVGNISGARRILQNGIRRNPGDAYLLHGLATLELKSGNTDAARGLFKEAIRSDPSWPNPYHALGTLEHSRGNIRVATTVLRHGLKMCPTNHRLHHALGDLYREARMLDLAELAYRKALECSPEWGKSFAYTALSYLAYEKGDRRGCRRLLQEGLEVNGGMHSQGWLSLAQLYESEGRIDAARHVYKDALNRYEKNWIKKSFLPRSSLGAVHLSCDVGGSKIVSSEGAKGVVQGRKPIARPSRSGDKWIFVYKSWARMEEHHGTYESAEAVYARAARAYPSNPALFLSWAQLQVKHGHNERARSLFEAACTKAGNRNADPYVRYAEFEMSQHKYSRARSILYVGAQALSESSDGGAGKSDDFAHLFHTWAVCEWHLSNLDRAEVLFDHALRLTDAGQKGSEIRSLILYSIARFLFDARREYVLAQHCVCLSLKENVMPGGNSQIWHLWSEIAKSLQNEKLADRCKGQAETLSREEDGGAGMDLSRLLGLQRAPSSSAESCSSSLPMMTGPAMQKMLKKEPWHHKIAGVSNSKSSWYDGVAFPELTVSEIAEGSDVDIVKQGDK